MDDEKREAGHVSAIASVRVGVDEYLSDSAGYMDRAMDGELVVVGHDGEIAMIVAGRLDPLD